MKFPFLRSTPAPKLLVFTGAGLSAPSGLKTFRDYNGLWHDFDPMKVANKLTFKENKELVFDFYNQRRAQLETVQPNNGHRMLAGLQEMYGTDLVKICTQNVDDLLERAGCKEVLHVHGKLTDMMCLARRHIWDVGYKPVDLGTPCPVCGNTGTKPGVIFFHEYAPEYQQMDHMFHEKRRNPQDVVLCIGTRFEVVPSSRILGYKTSFNILANLHRDDDIDYRRFDEVFIGDIEETAASIRKLIQEKLG